MSSINRQADITADTVQPRRVPSPVQYDIVVPLLSGQFVGGCYSGDGQQRLQEDRQTIVDGI